MPTKVPRIPIIELFGPTIQGEGLLTGVFSHFLRTGGCGLRCSWCDSMYAVLPTEVSRNRTMMTTAEILDEIHALPWAPYITFTGGDPCLHERLGDIIPAINMMGTRVAVETQGQLFPSWLGACDIITFSPKGPSSGNVVDTTDLRRWLGDHYVQLTGLVCIKVVVFIGEDEVVSPTSIPVDLRYALDVYSALPSYVYDSFYFSAGTARYQRPMYRLEEDDGFGYWREERILDTVRSEQLLADALLKCARDGTVFNDKVHVGCQQHVLLWPGEEKGV